MPHATELSDKHRMVIHMRDIEKRTFAEIASVLGRKRQTARGVYERAKLIQKRLERQNRTVEVALDGMADRRSGRGSRFMDYEYDPFRSQEWRDGWREADVFLTRGTAR